MRKTLLVAALILIGAAAQAQTEKELIGKWKLVRIVKGTEEVPVEEMFGTKEVYQVFSEKGKKFTATVGGTEAVRGTFRMSDDNKQLTIKSLLEDGQEMEKSSSIQFSDANNRTVTADVEGLGTLSLSYEKVK